MKVLYVLGVRDFGSLLRFCAFEDATFCLIIAVNMQS